MASKAKSKRCKTCEFLPCRCADLAGGETLDGLARTGWPIVSDALAVHSSQVKEATDDAAKKGVPTEFRKDGRPVLRDRAHRKAYLKAYGFVDRSSFYGS